MSKHNNRTAHLPTDRKLAIFAVCIAVIMLFIVLLNVLMLGVYDAELTARMGTSNAGAKGTTYGADLEYVKSDFHCAADLYAYEEKLCAEIAQDGTTLLKNDGLLPLKTGTQLDIYSVSSVNLVSGGSGSGSGSFELTVDLKTGLEGTGFKVNEKLWDFYKTGGGSSYGRGEGVVNYGRGYDWKIGECPVSVIEADTSVMNSIDRKNVAMFVISRTGGEGGDEPRDMKEFGGERGEHYLELDKNERDTVKFLGRHYDNVIILVNSNNAFELGFVFDTANYKNIKAVVNFPGAGRFGVYGLGYFLRGYDADGKEISPSGHLVDTLVYDNFSSPASQNFGDAVFTDAQGRVIMYSGGDIMYSNGNYGNKADEINEDDGRCPFYFVSYSEGIYVGYKYYETRYEDYILGKANVGSYDYAATVTYPFGFGASYTSFEWSGLEVSSPDANGNMTASVVVKNVGDRAGRDVVQLYYQAPYTDYDVAHHVEKASVNLGGFAKTGLLKSGSSERVAISFNINDFKSYDDSGNGGYILEAGDYYVTLAPDAHTAVNSILKRKCAGEPVLDNICETAELTGVPYIESSAALVYKHVVSESAAIGNVKNLFSDATLIDRADYLTRNNWAMMDNDGLRYATAQFEVGCVGQKNPWGNYHLAACTEINGKQFRAVIPDGLLEKLISSDSLIPDDAKASNATKPTLGADNGLELIDMRGLDYDDPLWDKLLEQVTADELASLIAGCGHNTVAMPSVNKPKTVDLDGPAGLNVAGVHGSIPIGNGLKAMTWVTEYMLASTWDEELALKMGEAVGEDGLHGDAHGWYGPGMNLHRTPFAGRNFEYYSEDAYISGVMGKAEVQGAARKGLFAYMKHFALNDQETHRDQNGLLTFSNEQAMRELYFKPFEIAIRDNTVTVNYNAPVKNESGKTVGYEMKQAEMPAATAVMSSFNRLGATWAGGNYNLITRVLREEFGFKGMVLTDYDTGNYMKSNNKQMVEAGGDIKLNIYNKKWSGVKKGGDRNENIRYALKAAKNVLYAVANSSAMNGYLHGYRPNADVGFAYYKIIPIIFTVLAAAGIAVLVWLTVRAVRQNTAAEIAETSDDDGAFKEAAASEEVSEEISPTE
ncbi:MAG: fibronectin type III-like domain-contianing protein [Clostridiales bacterium]|nr:fibronectin type III-like domain-contianing protein [Clostridiales bacterium]